MSRRRPSAAKAGKQRLRPEFVEFIPDNLAEGVLYISLTYSTAVHRCCCGCGSEVVTPLSPTDWKLTREGKTVSLLPSIGNWSFPCKSHYFITRNVVEWAPKWSADEIEAGRASERLAKQRFFEQRSADDSGTQAVPKQDAAPWPLRLLAWMKSLVRK